ncbi:hypothetical protein [Actinomadura alba]|uniref:Uncharacterized protein n=1 Tax=Actinomadura alba TaxID=406431 RepID=A0ABR7LPA5_9ACTN|nr:hypothetical protein [Actinomadura alba]MBC6466503.1 hypothetical protein [Actinomadura alba]
MNDIEPPVARTGSDFAQLSKRTAKLGLFERRSVYYGVRLTSVALLFAAAGAAHHLGATIG